jgi:predicted dienelactone hydrolase
MLLLALLACNGPEDTDTVDLATELTSPGPHSVGYRESSVTWGDGRELRLALWYPSDDETGAPTRYDGVFEAPGVFLDAGVAEGGPFPLVVFSHGHQGYAENSSFLMRHLASHGWVAAAPDHTGNTTFDGSDRTTDIYWQRPMDISAVLDHLEGLSGDPLAGRLAAPYVLIGHSFGGYTVHALSGATYSEEALAACTTDESPFCSTMDADQEALFRAGFEEDRFAAAVSMAPGDLDLFGQAGLGSVDIPVLFSDGTLDAGEKDEIWAGLARDGNLRLQLQGGGHQTFTDFSGILEDMDGLIEAEEGFRILDAYVLAWARRAQGDTAVDAVLSGEIAISEAALVIQP